MNPTPYSFNRFLLLGALLLEALSLPAQAQMQMDHSSMVSAKPGNACQGAGLECANAATPFFTQDGKLLLAWTASGVVAVAQSSDLGKTFSPAVLEETSLNL